MKWKTLKNISASVGIATVVGSSSFAAVDSDNSKVNRRDRSDTEVTADQQTAGGVDAEITRQIRQELMADKQLSTYAQNVKIITLNGRVTLKGPVRSREEESAILKYARSAPGVSRVTDKLEIARAK